ncbi:TetR/AcrR family transcriptional regulator [Aeromicrobium sp. SMF47]|uniref:TetR/AcrR family transcriptional regulator n=1 Tax=Aeromicrobium yanjiei TaxID=2662028 RepID=A0A5Q2MMC1_9ACTN|nr:MULTISPECIES: TetR/AcrR family transcriptional regulator [Aeromicrobium]MRJ75673.1 TetR/AcrR family transcriptional regulator [Aeromicrobium yanjiei]MRK00018.1 TetR/AcrR family transcriptional regulator [Aeromicrobium sp. S22]QGG43069.1 TetR/AcrR family transcriptional regulator [Aeromicrobium yanjiei]
MAVHQHTDGRVARGQRTRDAIVEAHTALLREGVLKPTAKVIAERAGISVRTLWLNYKDTETLLGATTAYWLDADAALRTEISPDLPLDQRLEQYLDMRVRRLEHLDPAARSAALGEPFSRALQDSRRQHVDRVRDDLAHVFGPELAAAGERRGVLEAALFVASSWPTWSSLRHDLGLEVDAARAVMRESVARLLLHGPGPGTT